MINSGMQFLAPVTMDQLPIDQFESLESIEGLKKTGLVLLKVDSAPQEDQIIEVELLSEPGSNSKPVRIPVPIETLELDYDRLWLFSLLQAQQKPARFRTFKTPTGPTLTMSLRELGRLAKERSVLIELPTNFDEQAYLQENPDVAVDIGVDGFDSGYEHYVLYGHLESRHRPFLSS
ncbi:MAG: hypothetical protein AAGB23_00400 [Pseudomonadota bacterium]